MSAQQSLQKDVLRNLSTVREGLFRGKSQKAIVKQLKKRGVSEESASQLVGDMAREFEEYKKTLEGRKIFAEIDNRGRMFRGLLWIIIGAVILGIVIIAILIIATSGIGPF